MRTGVRARMVLVVGSTAALAMASIVGAHPARGEERSQSRLVVSPVLSDLQVAALPVPAQAALLAPLRRLAGDLDAQGRQGKNAGGYSGIRIEAGQDHVDVFATSTTAGRSLLRAARRADSGAQWSRVRVEHGTYAKATLDGDAQRLLSAAGSEQVDAVAVPADGAGLNVEIDPSAVGTASRARASATGPAAARPEAQAVDAAAARAGITVPLAVTTVEARHTKSWRQDKWHDSSPFIGGDVLTSNGHNACTAGLPAVRRTDNVPVMITAAHCFATGVRVYTGGGTAGAYGNGLTGNYVGTVGTRNREWDAEPLVGANNNADESDTTGWKPLTSVAYSYDGDFVCQNGAYSFYLGHPTPCGIKVTDQDLYFKIGGYTARGVEGIDVRTGWGSHDGDSGGTVFAYEPHGVRQARGIISSGGLDGTPDQKRVDWTEAVDIFRAFDLKLNPHT